MTSYSLPAGTSAVVFDTVLFDDATLYDGAGTVTIDRAGLYMWSCWCTMGTTTSNGTPSLIQSVNGTSINLIGGSANTLAQGLALTALHELDVGDACQVVAQRHTSQASNLVALRSGWSLTRVGPVRWTS